MKNIPSEITLQILKQVQIESEKDLVQCIYVCKRWGYLALELLWHKPSFKSASSTSWLAFFTVIQSSHHHSYPYTSFIKRINLTPLSKQIHDIHIITLNACSRLERITLAGCSNLTNVGLCALINDNDGSIGNELISIDLSDVNLITDQTILKVASCCPNLQGLNLCMSQEQQLITDISIIELSKQCKNLKRVSFYCKSLFIVTETKLITYQQIKLNNCTKITEKSAINLAIHCPKLVEVDFMNCDINDEAIHAIFNNCKDLRELRLSQSEITNTTRITEYALTKATIPPNFTQLRMVDFTAITTVTDKSIEILVNSAPKIKSLVLNKCSRITDDGVLSICKLGRFLHYLHLGHCSNLTDKSVTKLAIICNRIRYLDMACCTEITDKSVIELSANLPKLKRIGLVKCSNITDISIGALTSHVKIANSLERIHLSYCTRLSVRSLSRLLNVCHKLNHLSLTNVPCFMRDDLQRFCRLPPKEFTELQRRSFCVYSGQGVQDLMHYLNSLYGTTAATSAIVGAGDGDLSLLAYNNNNNSATIG
jgi:F-box and leucine-rich repeat protein GRR1